MTEHNLALRPIGENDYTVMRDSRPIGRVRLSDERAGHEAWNWSITVPLPIPSFCMGSAPSMDAAKTAFRVAWEEFYARLTPSDIDHWHRTQDGARKRIGAQ